MKAAEIAYYLCHPQELRAIIQWTTYHEPVHTRDPSKETETEKKCYEFLKLTSRSFSAVIMELHPELLMPVCLFYLILRGLDTVEDDTSIPLETKEPILRGFKDILEEDGWTFTGNRPEEKDRELLVQFHNVITEFKKIKPAYKVIIKDITEKMGNGMADYIRRGEEDDEIVKTIEDYDLYCYYVAGLVGEGLTRLFVEAGFARPELLERPELFISMGRFLQKTNIIRDVREDHDDKRRFWPREIWSRHVKEFSDLFKPEFRQQALNCNSDMILNALSHVEDCIYYLSALREQSVFNFCCIPQTMAISTLELCFRNGTMFERNIKITKGTACRLMIDSTQNVRVACDVFRRYARAIHQKNTSKDPNFLKISMACGHVEKVIERIFPSQSPEAAARRLTNEKSPEQLAQDEADAEAKKDTMYIMLTIFGVLLFVTITMFFVAWLFGARFDLAIEEFKKGKLMPGPAQTHGGEL
ncbi:putative Farnesyl-diphosphate farnesyltransferase [Trichophyton interdigitale]|nr:putative Farnesyl-diphosphate farnesyltransferase [Trichophyton interdigitale]KAG5216574.1 putative Farnesyl-diphosphate farnesyltransferase [Trichophyton interdigitale]KAG8205073.1 putative Farnesyl-diphosphate farnesyltransferase [Trichophyton interdigitale]